MSQHPSFKGGAKHARHRSVLKRGERIKALEKEGKWQEDRSIFSLPKLKIMKFKIKKEKPAEATAEGVEGAEGTPAAETKDQKAAPKKEEKTEKTEKKEKKEKKEK